MNTRYFQTIPARPTSLGVMAIALALIAPTLWATSAEPSAPDPPARESEARLPPLPGDLHIRSGDSAGSVWAEVSGQLEFPFPVVNRALADPASWCDFLLLHLNTKACVHGSDRLSSLLVVYSGRKHYQPPEDSQRLDYRFTAEQKSAEALRVTLLAGEGPLGTRNHRIEVEAEAEGEHTAVRVTCSHAPSALSRATTAAYLATLGRGKVGFSHDDGGEPVAGVRGIIERNALRYHLALGAFLMRREAAARRFEKTLGTWFDLTARFPQLAELGRKEYLDTKRRERSNQIRLQEQMEVFGPQELPR